MMNNGLSTADAVLLTDRDRGSNNNGGWGGEGGWLWIFFLFFLLAWGNGGWGGFGGGNGMNAVQPALTRGELCQDFNFQDLQSGVRNIGDGLSRLGYELCNQFATVNSNINLGFSNLNSTICNAAYENAGLFANLGNTVQQGFNGTNMAIMQGNNALASQIASCCCDQRAATENVRFTIAQEDCATRNLLQTNTRDIIEAQNANTQQIISKLTQQEMAAKDAQIAAQTQQIFGLQLAASQSAQNQYLINQLRPTAVPAYLTCSPFASAYGIGNYGGYGFNSGCGCGCGCGSVA